MKLMTNVFSLIVVLLIISAAILTSASDPQKQGSKGKSNMTLKEALTGKKVPEKISDSLKIISVKYFGYDSLNHDGQLIIHKSLANETCAIFDSLFTHKFPIAKIKAMSSYGWDDDSSMADNNTSSFNYRNAANSKKLSLHAYGRALDINPKDNPYIFKTKVSPPNAKYDAKKRGTILKNSYIYKLFKKHGWKWGGDWKSLKDYQHFEK